MNNQAKPNDARERMTEMMDRRLKGDLKTQSGFETDVVYGPEHVADLDYERDIGRPGSFPFTRGTYPRMYREKLWVRGVPPGGLFYSEERGKTAQEALVEMFENGLLSSGIRTGGDYHNLATVDPDHPLVRYDVGGCTGPVYSLWQFAEGSGEGQGGASAHFGANLLYILKKSAQEGFVIELGHAVGPADVCEYTIYVALMEVAGLDPATLRGNMVNDPLHTHITRCMNYKQPLEVGFRLTVDSIEYCLEHTPRFRPTNGGCAYDMREVGINTVEELAFRFGNYIEYADAVVKRGIPFSRFGHLPTIALSGEIDFFETICKLRAARRMWARIARDRYGADPKSLRCPPCNTNLSGSSMTAQQPIFNVIRNTVEAMASVLGGVNGMEMKGYTEALTPPPQEAWAVNKAIEAIIAEEANIALVADPLGGSYYVEWLTNKIETEAMAMLKEILDMGGMIAAIKKGWVQARAEKAAQEREKELAEKRKIKVGVNAYQSLADYSIPLPMLKFQKRTPGERFSKKQVAHMERFKRFKESRDTSRAAGALRELHHAAKEGRNVIQPMIDAWKAYASIGEVMGVIREGMGFSYDQFEMVKKPDFLAWD